MRELKIARPPFRIPQERVANRMLYMLKVDGEPVRLDKLIEFGLGGPPERSGHLPFGLIYEMASEKLVKITRNTGRGKKAIWHSNAEVLRREVHGSGSWLQIFGIRAGDRDKAAAKREAEHYVELTDHFLSVQRIIGISTKELANREEGTISVTPVFGVPHEAKFDVFVAMPFSDASRPVFDDGIVPTCAKLGLTVGRADLIFGANHVMKDVWSLIKNSEKIIVDCTGRNPNVFYELGVAHAIGKSVLLIAQSADDIPFDLRHWRYALYVSSSDGLSELGHQISDYLHNRDARE